jgi:spermidine synthase
MLSSLWVTEKYKNTSLSFRVKNVLYREKSKFQQIEILETYDWGRIMTLDGLMMVTEKDEFFYHETITHLPMALLGQAENVLIIGGGDGGTARELAKYSKIKKIDLVEIDGGVIEASKKFMPFVGCGFDDPRINVILQDASEYIKSAHANHYDLIIADSSDPEGFAATLIETDFYKAIGKSLKQNGLYIAQSGSPLSQAEELKTTWRNLNSVFAHCEIAWSLTPTYPGAWWSFVIASNSTFTREAKNKIQPPDCRFWRPELTAAMLSRPPFISNLLALK